MMCGNGGFKGRTRGGVALGLHSVALASARRDIWLKVSFFALPSMENVTCMLVGGGGMFSWRGRVKAFVPRERRF